MLRTSRSRVGVCGLLALVCIAAVAVFATGAAGAAKKPPKPGNYTAISTKQMRISFKVERDGTIDLGRYSGRYGEFCSTAGGVGFSSGISETGRFQLGEPVDGQNYSVLKGRFIDPTHVRGTLKLDQSHQPDGFCPGVYTYKYEATTLKPPK